MTNRTHPFRTLVAAGLLAGSAGFALAQTAPAPAQPATPAAPAVTTATPAPATQMFVPGTALGSEVTKISDIQSKAVYNLQDEKIGTVSDLLLDRDGKVGAVVIGVGGFLGMGTKDVAVSYASFRINRDGNSEPKIVLDVAKDTLKNAPEYAAKTAANPS